MLSTSQERRSDVEAAAVEAFAARGFYGTTTSEVAAAAGISQAYLYKIYPDKTAVFVAALDHGSERLAGMLRQSLREHPEPEQLDAALRSAARRIAEAGALTRLLLHASVAAAEPRITEAVHRCYAKQYEVLRSHRGATDAAARRYMADSTLANVMRAASADSSDAAWARALLDDTRD